MQPWRMMDSQITSSTITDVAQLQDSAKMFCTQLVNSGNWTKKKKAPQNASACAGNQNGTTRKRRADVDVVEIHDDLDELINEQIGV